ncbi:aminotransferase class I/II-fold pyridoxal phosphate-dependent enzyme [bacterium]|nr:aminotransferase class I/II-fold pyridoxal phosphate-dependent enzyme [bacterium]
MKQFFNEFAAAIDTYIMFKIKEKTAQLANELTKKGRKPISLAMGAPTTPPPKMLIEGLKTALDENGIHTYSNPKGEKYLIDAIKLRMKNRFSVEIETDEICSLLGSKEGIANLLRGIITPAHEEDDKDIIMVPDPSYASYAEMVKVSGGRSYSVPLTAENNYTPEIEKVYEQLQKDGYDKNRVKALIINYPNNPLGASCSKEYLKQVVDFCKNHEILLISDAAYADIYFEEKYKPSSALEIEDAKDITVEFHSFSKPYSATGWRIGWVCGNKEVVSQFAKLKSTIDSGIFKAIQLSCAKILNTQEGDEYIVWANNEIKKKSDYFTEAFKNELNWEIEHIPTATFYQWIKIPPRYKTSEEFCDDLLQKSGIVMVPGTAFGKYGSGYVRVSIVCSLEELQEVVKRMKEDGFTY